jgi:hypothetical protein
MRKKLKGAMDDMAVLVGSARIDERGKAHGGKAGDQTGREVSTQNWYAHSKSWVVLRAKSAEAREKIALCMEAACRNKYVGYDQYQRNTLYNAAKEFDFDVSKVTKKVETDCSALVRVCVNYAGIPVGDFRTTNQAAVLMATGAFEKYTDDAHCRKSANLLRGDILVTRTQGHTVVVLADGANAAAERAAEQIPDPETAMEGKSSKLVTITGNSVNIRLGNSTMFGVVTRANKGTTFQYVATAENGWHAVVAGKCVAWVSGKYSRIV